MCGFSADPRIGANKNTAHLVREIACSQAEKSIATYYGSIEHYLASSEFYL